MSLYILLAFYEDDMLLCFLLIFFDAGSVLYCPAASKGVRGGGEGPLGKYIVPNLE
jgi:hypothetical protein